MKILKDLVLYIFIIVLGLICAVGIMPWCIYAAYINDSDVTDEIENALEAMKRL